MSAQVSGPIHRLACPILAFAEPIAEVQENVPYGIGLFDVAQAFDGIWLMAASNHHARYVEQDLALLLQRRRPDLPRHQRIEQVSISQFRK
jgi:hypothetical protein